MDARLPDPLRPGDTIAVTAPSFEVLEGARLRDAGEHHVSASGEARAAVLTDLLLDPGIAAVIPPRGGETGIDVLPLLDLDLLAQVEPCW